MNKRIRKKLAKRSGFHSYHAALKDEIAYFDRCLAECMWLEMEMGRLTPGPYTLATEYSPITIHGQDIGSWEGRPWRREDIEADLNAVIAGYRRWCADDV